jgi:carboxyl-terminal processing protease
LFQRFDNAPSLGAIKITMQQFYRPSGASTQLEGVKSDVELPSITTHLPVGESDLDYAVAFDRLPAAAFRAVGRVNEPMLGALRQQSQSRVAAHDEFKKLGGDIERYERRKKEKTLSLVESVFEQQWNEGKAAEDEEKKLEEMESHKRPVVKRDFYFDEAMNVTVDYLRALAGGGGIANAPQQAEVSRPATPVPVPAPTPQFQSPVPVPQ